MNDDDRNDDSQNDAERFAEIVSRLAFMSKATGLSVAEEAIQSGLNPAEFAVQKSLLKAVDADIVNTLLRPGLVVPGYEILDLAGRGGMGVVYRATQTSLDRIVALKLILSSGMLDDSSINSFKQEARTVAKLRHPNIVDALDFGMHEDRWYFAMEFIEGNSAQKELNDQRRFSESVVWAIVRQAAAGLAHAQRHGVTHHDVKPANMMLVKPPEGYPLAPGVPLVKIADFGLSHLSQAFGENENEVVSAPRPVGSPPYMAPELFRGGTPGVTSDIYSLGVTALHLLTAERIFFGDSYSEVIAQKNNPETIVTAQRFPNLARETRDMLIAMIAANPEDRPVDFEAAFKVASELSTSLPTNAEPADVHRWSRQESRNVNTASTTEKVAGSVKAGPDNRPNSSSARRLLVPALLILATVLIGLAAWGTFSGNDHSERLTNVVETEQLFDGSTLSNFSIDQSMTGAWQAATAPDFSPAFTCRSQKGAINCRLPDWPAYRVTLFVLPGVKTRFADIVFDTSGDGRQSVIRFAGDEVILGEKTGDFSQLRPYDLPTVNADLRSRFHVVSIERQPGQWFLFFEEQFIGNVPPLEPRAHKTDNVNSENFIRISAEQELTQDRATEPVSDSDYSYFTDFFVERLQYEDAAE